MPKCSCFLQGCIIQATHFPMELLAADVSKQKLQLNAVQKYKQSTMQELMLNQKCLATNIFLENLGNPQTDYPEIWLKFHVDP